ncbi:hypothetical protein ACQ4LE_005275 [Meloidogyne hapla]
MTLIKLVDSKCSKCSGTCLSDYCCPYSNAVDCGTGCCPKDWSCDMYYETCFVDTRTMPFWKPKPPGQ